MTETTITWQPADVPVSDDRGTVAGAQVTVSRGGVERVDTVIPPAIAVISGEILRPIDWVGPGLLDDCESLHVIFVRAAYEGAAGRGGCETLTD